ncbi:hypothetical protein ACIBF6_00405 [Streptosporangium amethystogenes]|uniref:hypothetical protein n=1 Tax=Streptosporangium amethystogenes TaxID=2002 RepID=UPI0037880000
MVNQVKGNHSPKDASSREARRVACTLIWALLFSLSVLITLVGFIVNVYDYSWNTGEIMGVDPDALLVARLISYTAISMDMLSMLTARTISMRIASVVLGFAVIAQLVSLPD